MTFVCPCCQTVYLVQLGACVAGCGYVGPLSVVGGEDNQE